MFVSCNIAENYWVGRSGFLFFFLLFVFRIVMHHNAAKSKNRHYTLNFDIFTLEDKLRHVLKLSIWFEINSHESKIRFPLFFSPWVKKKFWVGGFQTGSVGLQETNIIFFFGLNLITSEPHIAKMRGQTLPIVKVRDQWSRSIADVRFRMFLFDNKF